MQGDDDYFCRHTKAKRNESTQSSCHIKETVTLMIKSPIFRILELGGADAQYAYLSAMSVPTERELCFRLG